MSQNLEEFKSLEEIASLDDWLEFGTELIRAMNSHDQYAQPTGQAVLSKVARLRKRQELSMRKVVIAATFIQTHFPQMFLNGTHDITMSDALKIRMIFTKNVGLIDKITADVIETLHNRGALKKTIAEHEALAAIASPEHSNPAQKSLSFKSVLRAHLSQNLLDYLGSHDFQILGGKTVKPSADLVIMKNGQPYIAIETKPRKVNVQVREIYELLGVCSLRLKPVEQNWIICDPSWTQHLGKIEDCRAAVSLKGINVGIFDPNADQLKIRWSDTAMRSARG